LSHDSQGNAQSSQYCFSCLHRTFTDAYRFEPFARGMQGKSGSVAEFVGKARENSGLAADNRRMSFSL
jgi:hypothetical protein